MTSAKVKISNIGGLRGEYNFEFNKGILSSIEGSNSGGKSSIIQALTAALSIPRDCDLDSFFQAEAVKLGIRTDISNSKEGFVHVLASDAYVSIEYDQNELEYIVDSKGVPQKCSDGNPGFLVSGVLSNKSKVIRQLRGQDDRHEPDDFKWAVTELSLAKRYEDVLNFLKTGYDETRLLHSLARNKSKDNEKLLQKQSQLETKKAAIESEITELKENYKAVSDILAKIEKLRESRSEFEKKLSEDTRELREREAQTRREKKILEQLKKKADQKQKEFEAIDIDKLKTETEKHKTRSQTEVSELMKERDALDGILNLFVVAESNIDKDGTLCPLCGKGHLTYTEVNSKVSRLREQRDELNSRIGELNLSVRQKKKQLDDKTIEKKELRDEFEDLRSQIRTIETPFRQQSAIIKNLEFNIRDNSMKIENIDKQISSLSEKVGAGSKKAQQEYLKREKESQKVSDDLAITNQKLSETSVEIGMDVYQPNIAEKIAEGWLKYYETLINYTSKKAEDQRIRASEQFNSTIKDLLERLNFKEFRTVMLNQDYRLYIERFDEKKKDYVFQQVKTLSTSEQMSIALILQVALKETYLPHIPFLLIDDIMEDFDEGRREEVLTYLRGKAKENNWFIISTRLVEGIEGIRVV